MFGLEEGDRLLRAIAHLVREQIDKRRETFARLSGDVFVACLAGDRDRVRRFVGWLSRQLREYTQSYRVMLFFGICPVEKRRTPVHVLCDWAHLALKTVKGSDLTNYAFYDGELRARLLDENNIKDQMHEALEKGQFVLYLQPKVEISSGRIVGAEALARWRHPTDGLILPGRFVPLFERNGFIVRFDEYIWEQTCKMLRLWLDKGYRPTPVSINVSRMHFNDDHFSGKLLALTDKYHLPRHLLELELTESAFFESEKTLIRVMNDLQKQGFVFSMDDFGTGYSSLSTLRALPFNIVKLDRTFISDGTDNERGPDRGPQHRHHGPPAQDENHRRRRGNRGAGALSAQHRLQLRPGLLLRAPGGSRGIRSAQLCAGKSLLGGPQPPGGSPPPGPALGLNAPDREY